MKTFLEFDWDKPDFVNQKGVKWWFDEATTNYAIKKDHNGIALFGVVVWIIKEKNDVMTRLLVEDNKIIFENQNLEAIASHIDMMKANKSFKQT
jgi:hypothetical protein